MFVKHECPQQQQSPKLTIFSIKVTIKVTRSLTLVSFEWVSSVEYACQIWSLYLLRLKSYGQGESFFGHKVTNRQDKIKKPLNPIKMMISAIQIADRDVSEECYGNWPKYIQELCHYGQVHSGTGSLSSYACACKALIVGYYVQEGRLLHVLTHVLLNIRVLDVHVWRGEQGVGISPNFSPLSPPLLSYPVHPSCIMLLQWGVC